MDAERFARINSNTDRKGEVFAVAINQLAGI